MPAGDNPVVGQHRHHHRLRAASEVVVADHGWAGAGVGGVPLQHMPVIPAGDDPPVGQHRY